jgi:hypothetical protein
METTTIVIIVVVLILLVVVGIVMTKPKSEVEVDTELAKDVAEAETELEEKTADLQAANEELAANPTEEKAVEVAKKAEEVKEASAKVEEKKTEQAVETAKKIDCKVSEWGEYSQCEKVGDAWKKKKTRSILTQPSRGGVACPSDLEMSEVCKSVDCVTERQEWSKCKFDDKGRFSRTRGTNILTQPMYGGKACDDIQDYESCGDQLLGIGDDGNLYITSQLSPSDWVMIPNSALPQQQAVSILGASGTTNLKLIDITIAKDGRILASASNGEIYMKDRIADNTVAPWYQMGGGSNGSLIAICALNNNKLLGIGTNYNLFIKDGFNSNAEEAWTGIGFEAPRVISQLPTGQIFCTGITSNAPTGIPAIKPLKENNGFVTFIRQNLRGGGWIRVPTLDGVVKLVPMSNTKIIGIDKNGKLVSTNFNIIVIGSLLASATKYEGDGWKEIGNASVGNVSIISFTVVPAKFLSINNNYYPNVLRYTQFPNQGPFLIKNISKRGDMCIDDGGATTAGQFKMTMKKCDENRKNQLFTYDSSTKQIKSVNTPGLCVDDGGGATRGSTKFHLWNCDANNQNQKFEYDSDKKLIKSATKSNLCLDDDAGKGETFHFWDCDANNNNQKYALYGKGTLGPSPFSKGRYVSVGYINRSSPNYLHVASIEVFDQYNNLISRGKPTTQTTKYSDGDNPIFVVDKDSYGGISITKQGTNEFFEIDLGKEYEISRIVVYNRPDCCQDRLEQARIIISTSSNRANPVYTSDELTSALFQWVYPPSVAVHEDIDAGYGDVPRGFYNIFPEADGKLAPLVRCREIGDRPNTRISCSTPDTFDLNTYNGKSIKDILGNLYNFPSNFIRMFKRRQTPDPHDTF